MCHASGEFLEPLPHTNSLVAKKKKKDECIFLSGVLMKISVLYKKLNTGQVCYNFSPPFPLKRDSSLRKIKNTISVLVKGLNNTVHVQQQTPFSNVKSPISPKHRKK